MQSSLYRIAHSRSSASTSPEGPKRPAAALRDHAQLLEYRRRFALAIVKPGGNALLVDENNDGAGWVAIDTAITRSTAFAVEVADDIFAAESDCPDNAAAVHQLVQEMRNAGRQPVLIASGQVGHFHVLARIADEAERKRLDQHARDLKLQVRRSIRPPLAPHRLGLPPELLEPADPDAALEALGPERARRLSQHMQHLLKHGDRSGRYASRSEVVQALVLAAVNAGWPFERTLFVLSDPRNVGGAKVQQIAEQEGGSRARAYVRRSWGRARARVASSPAFRDRDGAREVVQQIEQHADAIAWPGKAGSTDRAVLQAHLDLARELGLLTYGASDRSIGLRAGTRYATANEAHRRLVVRGWLRRLQKGTGSKASTWRLDDRRQGQKRNTPPSSRGACE